ncbi:MAG: 4Fe-4S binding protein [Candidatus Adiutrix sp.]|jgi:ferredoxin|nr:4Fe-4S binding protein [Candidatus Adiutrix sp.]
MSEKKKRRAAVDHRVCASCGECAETCPRLAITVERGMYAVVDAGRCIGCGACAAVCPASAITMEAAS